ncbi:MAG: Mur ligase family protein [Candidatus Dormibacteraeota bacterium]|nr:Mur ligase family protein [Candidatus Dormibacteraeota bacterium]
MTTSPPPGSNRSSLRVPPILLERRDQRVDVVGIAGVEGGEMARYLLRAGFTKVVGHDQQPDLAALERADRLAHAGEPAEASRRRLEAICSGVRELMLGDRYLHGIEDSTLIIPSQAWFLNPANLPVRRLLESGAPSYSLTQAYLDLANCPVIGVTGSHGKSTTSSLVAAGLRRTAKFEHVWLGGNDRHNQQALEQVAEDRSGSGCLVLEISNRQLLQMSTAPCIAGLTNITPNHLDEHGGMEGYVRTKRKIFDLPGCRVAVRNADDPISMGTGPVPMGTQELRFSRSAEGLGGLDGAYLDSGSLVLRRRGRERKVLELADLRLRGDHNHQNALAAVTLCSALHDFPSGMEVAVGAGICQFGTLAHRIQLVWQELGVDYYDDLSSTTPQSTIAAMRTLARPVVLICGGQDKGIPFDQLANEVGNSARHVILLPGEGSDRLAEALQALGMEGRTTSRPTLLEAVSRAREIAEPGDAILLSPACPGFFSAHYAGGGFRSVVRRLSTSPRQQRARG